MVSSVEIFDPRRNSWRVGDSMNFPRGYASTVTLGDNVFVIGGLQSSEKFMDSVSRPIPTIFLQTSQFPALF
jgi:N-acetylneuraminic acid mutarotase